MRARLKDPPSTSETHSTCTAVAPLWHRCGTAVAYHRCGTTMAPPRRTPRPVATGAHDRPSYTLLRWLLPASKAANSPDPMVREGTLVS